MILTSEDFLKSRGWHTHWSEDNWVHASSQNPDWAGVSMEQALKIEKNKDMTNVIWKQNNGKWEAIDE